MKQLLSLISVAMFLGILTFILTNNVNAQTLSTDKAVVTISFDDGPKSIYTAGLPKLKKYNIPATIYLSTAFIGQDSWYMNWNQVKSLSNNGWEIASHGYTHPDFTTLDDVAIENELEKSKAILLLNGYNAVSFATPYGEYNDRVLSSIKQKFQSNRRAWDDDSANEGFNDLHSFDKYNISAKELTKNTTVSKAKKLIDKAVKNKKWLVFFLHSVSNKNPKSYEYSASNLSQIASYLSQQQNKGKLQVQTIDGFLSSH